jgi:carbon-monoxide dehydrogenase medium subunit
VRKDRDHGFPFPAPSLHWARHGKRPVTGALVPLSNPARTGSAYLKVAQPASGFALTGVAAQVTLGSDNTVQQVAVAVTGVDNTAFRASATENALRGQAATEAAIEQAANLATEGAEGTDDIHASAEYRLHLTRVYTKRALLQAVQRAQA